MALGYNTTAASQALRGQSVKVTLSTGDFEEIANYPSTAIGTSVSCGADVSFGTIGSIDYFGNSLEVVPLQPNLSFNDSPGYLTEGAIVTFYI